VLRKTVTSKPKTEHALATAKAKGQVETVSRSSVATGSGLAKYDDPDAADKIKRPTVTLEFKLALQKARQAKGWSQADLAKQINQPQKMIQDYESGKAVPQGQTINILNRKLGTVLPKIPKPKKVKDPNDD